MLITQRRGCSSVTHLMSSPSHGFLLIDKPASWTSFDVVAKLRRTTGERTIGHAGTLDPFATGLLIVAVGRPATKQLDTFLKQDKTYQTTFTLGATSTTQDPEGELTPTGKPLPTLPEIEHAIATHFLGAIEQIPPMHSAIKIGGKKLYELARQGKEVERAPRRVTIHDFSIHSYNPPLLEASITVSSGTYIRAIARDLGEILGCGAYCSALRRTRIGMFSVEHAHTMTALSSETWRACLNTEMP